MARISSDSNCSEAARQNVTFISLLPSNSRINVFKKSSFNLLLFWEFYSYYLILRIFIDVVIMKLKIKQFLSDSGSIKVVFVILNS